MDTVKQSEQLFALSNSANALFLLDPKGHFLRIHTSEAISMTVRNRTPSMPQTMTIGWAEVGSTDGVSVIAAPGGEYYPTDTVIATTIRIDPQTGALIWATQEPYRNGSTLQLNQNTGELIQNADGAFTAAVMKLDQDTGILTASVTESGGE